MHRGAAIVTGSTSGICPSIARRLAASGRPILLNGLGTSIEIRTFYREIWDKHRVPVVHKTADMRNPSAIEAMIARARRRFGRIDILINNAGVRLTAPIQDFPQEQEDPIIAVNLTAAFHTIRFAAPGMVAPKHGLVGLTKIVALEMAGGGNTCDAVCPGWVLMPPVDKQIADRTTAEGTSTEAATKALLAAKQPSGHFATAEQLGDRVVFLPSPAADQLTGKALAVDLGWTAQ